MHISKTSFRSVSFELNSSLTSYACVYADKVPCFWLLILMNVFPDNVTHPFCETSHASYTDRINWCLSPIAVS